MELDQYRVAPDRTVDLSARPTEEGGELDRDDATARTDELNVRLGQLQELLYAEAVHKVLIVIQATDTGGKDGTIRRVFAGVNPQGVTVASFKRPTPEEFAHDFLWRVHRRTPGAGEMTIFNRSHYEDVLTVRVHDLVPEDRWSQRYDHINGFERMLSDEGTTIVKFFLHISKDEQRQRLQERLDTPEKNWKFDPADLAARAHWDAYQEAYRVMLERTSTDHAPWYVIPADRKWFRDLVVSEIVVSTLEGLEMSWPAAEKSITSTTVT